MGKKSLRDHAAKIRAYTGYPAQEPYISEAGLLVVEGDETVTKDEASLMKQGYTWAQIIQRREMLESAIQDTVANLDAVTTPHDDAQRSVVSGGKPDHFDAPRIEDLVKRQPITAGAVLDDLLGPVSEDEDVREEALMLIREHGDGLVLNWQQWPIVQKLVELGIVSGRAGS